MAAGVVFLLEKSIARFVIRKMSTRFGLPLLGVIPEIVDQDVAEAIIDKKSSITRRILL